jgi:CO dehydrogenase maturation factor
VIIMKIAVCGKGGSGKSTVVALLAQEAEKRKIKTLVVDSDESNSGLFRMLGFERPPVPLMEMVGGKKNLKQKMGQPNIFAETEITAATIPEHYMLQRDSLKLVSIGKILQSLEGCACPMGVLSREFLKKLKLEDNEVAIVDMEAGIEHFGRGVETSINAVLIVVEPPLESIDVGKKIHDLAREVGIKDIWAVMNKVPSAEVADSLKARLKERHFGVVGCLYYDADVFKASLEGRIPENGVAVSEIKEVLDNILPKVDLTSSK